MLNKLFCSHNYELIDTVKHYETSLHNMPYATTKVFMCKACGKVKKIKY